MDSKMRDRRANHAPSKEHGDWRMPSSKMAENAHLINPPLSVWKKLNLRAEHLQQTSKCSILRSTMHNSSIKWEHSNLDVPVSHPWTRLWRLAIAIFVFLPLLMLMTLALVNRALDASMGVERDFWLSASAWYTVLGLLAFVVLILFSFLRPLLMLIYVLGHELTHLVAAKLCLGKIHGFQFSVEGGYVETDVNNFFVALSPYFVPFWMVLWLASLTAINALYPLELYNLLFFGGLGFWGAFHVYWTSWIMPREQLDILENGMLFSSLLICLMNVGMLVALSCSFGLMSWASYGREFTKSTLETVQLMSDLYAYAGSWLSLLMR